MHIVSNRCRTFEYRVTAMSPCAVDLEPSAIRTRKLFRDCLLLNVGVQRGDIALADEAVRLVRRIAVETDAAEFVVNGSANLPSVSERQFMPKGFDVLSELADTLDVLTEFTERLAERGARVHLMPFGWQRSCRVDPLEGAGTRRIITMSADGKLSCLGAYASDRSRPPWRLSCARSSRPERKR